MNSDTEPPSEVPEIAPKVIPVPTTEPPSVMAGLPLVQGSVELYDAKWNAYQKATLGQGTLGV